MQETLMDLLDIGHGKHCEGPVAVMASELAGPMDQ
jgi:hypothetical protein